MGDTATTTPGPTTTGPTTTGTTKKTRTPLTYTLVAIQRDESGTITGYVPVPQPTIAKETPRRDDYRRAVKKALEDGEDIAVNHWNGVELTIVGHPESFKFNAKVEEVTVRKVIINET